MISLPELVLLVFAAYRGTRLLVHDDIAAPLRNPVFAWHDRKTGSRARQAAVTLVSCAYCMGVWVSAAALAAWLAAVGRGLPDPLEFIVTLLAVSGGQALLNRWDDTRDPHGEGVA